MLKDEHSMLRGQHGELEKQVLELPVLRSTAEQLQQEKQALMVLKKAAEKQHAEFEHRVESFVQMSADKVVQSTVTAKLALEKSVDNQLVASQGNEAELGLLKAAARETEQRLQLTEAELRGQLQANEERRL